MSHTNNTAHYNLPQFIGTDTPGWLTDVNQAMTAIDNAIYGRAEQITTLSGNLTNLTARVTTAEGDIDTLEGQTDSIADDLTSVTSRVTTAESNIAQNTTAISAVATTVNGLRYEIISTTIPAASWSGGMFTVNNASLALGKVKFVGLSTAWLATASADDVEEVTGALIMPVSEAAGSVTLKAFNGAPTIDMAIQIIISPLA